jgi:2,3-dihydroxybenzoate-AMP ligase
MQALYDAKCWPTKTFADQFDEMAGRMCDREALVGGANMSQRYTYKQMKLYSQRVALHFLELGLQRGDTVIVQMTNLPEFGIMWLAFNRIGVIPVMCLPQHRYTELSQIAAKAGAVAYISCGESRGYNYSELMDTLADELGMKWKMIAGAAQADKIPEGYVYINDWFEDPIEERLPMEDILAAAHPDPHDVCILLLSGGTTGTPKLIPREYNAYVYYATECSREIALDMYTVQLAVAPVAHNFVLAAPGIVGCWVNGGKVVMLAENSMDAICKTIQEEKITEMPMVPTMIIKLLNFEHLKDYDLSSLTTLINGASKLEPSLAVTVKDTLGCELISQFGMSEGTITQTRRDDPDPEVRFATIGLPISAYDEWKILDHDDGHVIAQSGPVGDCFSIPADSQTGVPGEICFRGPYTIRGYYRAPERNVEAFTPDGFYKSGDMACLHESRRGFVIMGRYKDAINRGGEKFSCEEVENACHESIEWIHDCALVAMPDKILGEKGCLYVELKPEFEDKASELTVAYIQKALDGKLAKFKMPERVEIRKEMKKTNIGKIDKANLKKEIAAIVAEEEAKK